MNKVTWVGIRITIDMIAVVFAWCIAYYLRFYLPLIPVTKGIPDFGMYLKLIVFIILIWSMTFRHFGLYKDKVFTRVINEFFTLSKAHTIALIIYVAFTYFFEEFRYSRVTLIYYWFIGLLFLTLGRSIFRKLVRFFRRSGTYHHDVVIVGTGPTSTRALNYLSDRSMNPKVIGHVNIGSLKVAENINNDCQIIALDNLKEFLKKNQVREVIIALELSEQNFIPDVLKNISEELIQIKIINDYHSFIYLNTSVDVIHGTPIISINESPLLQWWNIVSKRVFDIVVSIFCLIVFCPIMFLVAIIIKLTSKGPIFYLQDRMGLDGVQFNMYKFRSMEVDAEQKSGAVWAKKNDTRKTPFGSFLRKTSLDEFPQLFNVLKGEMSLVGPRPERPHFVDKFKKEIPGYMLRHKAKAGMTGWAQINGWRGNTSLDQRIQCDLYYINHWSILLDIKIMFLTIFKGFVNKNAY